VLGRGQHVVLDRLAGFQPLEDLVDRGLGRDFALAEGD